MREVILAGRSARRATSGVGEGDAHGPEAREALPLGRPGPALLHHFPQERGDLLGPADLPAVGAADSVAVRGGEVDDADAVAPHAGEQDGMAGVRDGLGLASVLVPAGEGGAQVGERRVQAGGPRARCYSFAPIVIEDDVSIGTAAVITQGVTIGAGAVITAGAVVTCDVPAGTVVAGVPTQVIKTID
ncbi:hypothetical protein AB0O68_36225 [Streptomyces sp. NPDC087512]|uniref:acyltransferase n=1 Tax=Streptomyces sp. NPDC087512 TaxID=3155059 RepID=UPI00343C46AE